MAQCSDILLAVSAKIKIERMITYRKMNTKKIRLTNTIVIQNLRLLRHDAVPNDFEIRCSIAKLTLESDCAFWLRNRSLALRACFDALLSSSIRARSASVSASSLKHIRNTVRNHTEKETKKTLTLFDRQSPQQGHQARVECASTVRREKNI